MSLSPRALRALFVTSRWDAPYRYRCAHASEQLRREGAVANVLHIDDRALPDAVERYGVLVLFRLPWSSRVEELVNRARRAGVPIVFDIDDLVFDPAIAEHLPFRKSYTAEAWHELYGKPAVNLRRTFEVSDFFIGSTDALAEHARSLGKRASVHRNVVPDLYLGQGTRAARLVAALRLGPTVGYFAGSNTHDEDLAVASGALCRVLRQRPDVRLIVGGFIDLDSELARYAPRIVRLPYMHFRHYGYALSICRVNVAPLSGTSAFTDAKSALKFFEAGAFFTPTIASPVREMTRAIDAGETGLFAATEDEWAEGLFRLLDPAESNRLGQNARRATELNESADSVRGRLAAILADLAVPSTGPVPRSTPLYPPESPALSPPIAAMTRPFEFVGDLTALVRAVRAPPGGVPDARRFDQFIEAVRSDARARQRARAHGGILLVVDSTEMLQPVAQIGGAGDLPGEVSTLGPDPAWRTVALELGRAPVRYLVVRIRASASGRIGRAQCYFKLRGRPLSEARSVSLSTRLDGVDQTTIVDLWQGQSPIGRTDLGRLEWLRFDPLDRPGSVRLSMLTMVSEAALAAVLGSAEEDGSGSSAEQPFVDMSGLPTEAAIGALVEALAGLRPGRRLRVVASCPPTELRALLRDAFDRCLPSFEVLDVSAGGPGSSTAVIARSNRGYRGLAVVVPVHGALDATLCCLESVVQHRPKGVRLVVIDDASPDPRVPETLRRFARNHEDVELVENEKNLGFVETCNIGMSRALDRDVLLLNSDTEVFEGFAEGLIFAAYSREDVGIVCPLSNNATICSVPQFCEANEVPDGLSRAEMADLVRRTSLRRRPELVTAHGFCMYIRRDCLDAAGPFDPQRYGAGFGEENDFAERAKQAGRRIVLADDVYVWHEGSASFGDRAALLSKAHASILEGQHPGYHAAVARFISDNPLSAVHENLRVHLARGSLREEPAVLQLLHASPFAEDAGGVEHCVRDLVEAVAAPRMALAYPSESGIEVAEVLDGDLHRAERYTFSLSRPAPRFCHEHSEAVETLGEILDVFRIDAVHVHHLMYWPLSAGRLFAERSIPLLVTVHDYYFACPSFNLLRVDRTEPCCPGSACDAERTRDCMRALHGALAEPLGTDPVAMVDAHRRAMRSMLMASESVTSPSATTARLIADILKMPPSAFEVRPHGYAVPSARPVRHRGALRVAVVGNVAYASKGAEAVLETIARTRDLELEWHFFGRVDLFGFEERLRGIEGVQIEVHGPYDRKAIVERLSKAGIDVGLLMPAWPETFSYTLSELAAAGAVIVARRVGALADRIEAGLPGILVADAAEAAQAIRQLALDPAELERRHREVAAFRHPPVTEWAERFAEDYHRCLARTETRQAQLTEAERFARLTATRSPHSARVARRSSVTEPDSRHRSAWWYAHAERLKTYAPEGIRHVVRRALSGDGLRTVQRFRLPGRRAKVVSGMTLDRTYIGTARLVVHDDDPHLSVDVRPFAPTTVDAVRFNLWCGATAAAHAQIYWMHRGDDAFSEQKSVTVRLDSRSGVWQEYVADLRGSPREDAWRASGEDIVALRFDPIDVPGPICLGELALCKRREVRDQSSRGANRSSSSASLSDESPSAGAPRIASARWRFRS